MRAHCAASIAALVLSVAASAGLLTGCGTGPPGASGPGAPVSTVPVLSGSASAGTASASPAGTVRVASPAPEPTRTLRIVAGPSGRVTLTEGDDGATVVLSPGQSVTVVLGGQALGSWHQPSVAMPRSGVLRRVSAAGGYPGTAPAWASFKAVRHGRAVISSMSDARCLHATPPCEIAQRIWRVIVVVT